MSSLKELKKQLNLRCEYCDTPFTCRQSKNKHLNMNRCPEIKKKITAGEMGPYAKKQKVVHESVIVRSEPIVPAVIEKYMK